MAWFRLHGCLYEAASEIPQPVEECFRPLLDTAAMIEDPFEQTFFAMAQLPCLQPFGDVEDVDERGSRLAANLPLMRDDACSRSFAGPGRRS